MDRSVFVRYFEHKHQSPVKPDSETPPEKKPDEPPVSAAPERPAKQTWGRLDQLSGMIGHWILVKVDRFLNLLAFFWICLKVMVQYRSSGRRIIGRVTIQQIYFTGVQSVEIIAFIAFILGGGTILQGLVQLEKLGRLENLSDLLIAALIREVGPCSPRSSCCCVPVRP